jgi:DNA-binding XRE family transcriptional regulator
MDAMNALVSVDVRRLKALRTSLGLDQPTVAERLGVHRSVISHLEVALEPGGVMDRYFELLTTVACENAAMPVTEATPQ